MGNCRRFFKKMSLVVQYSPVFEVVIGGHSIDKKTTNAITNENEKKRPHGTQQSSLLQNLYFFIIIFINQ